MTRWMSDDLAIEKYDLIQKGMEKYGLTEKAACQRIGFNPASVVWLKRRVKSIKEEFSYGKEQSKGKEGIEETSKEEVVSPSEGGNE